MKMDWCLFPLHPCKIGLPCFCCAFTALRGSMKNALLISRVWFRPQLAGAWTTNSEHKERALWGEVGARFSWVGAASNSWVTCHCWLGENLHKQNTLAGGSFVTLHLENERTTLWTCSCSHSCLFLASLSRLLLYISCFLRQSTVIWDSNLEAVAFTLATGCHAHPMSSIPSVWSWLRAKLGVQTYLTAAIKPS